MFEETQTNIIQFKSKMQLVSQYCSAKWALLCFLGAIAFPKNYNMQNKLNKSVNTAHFYIQFVQTNQVIPEENL